MLIFAWFAVLRIRKKFITSSNDTTAPTNNIRAHMHQCKFWQTINKKAKKITKKKKKKERKMSKNYKVSQSWWITILFKNRKDFPSHEKRRWRRLKKHHLLACDLSFLYYSSVYSVHICVIHYTRVINARNFN